MTARPFGHAELVKNGLLKTFSSINVEFGKVFSEPCVLFADEPTLRSGDAAYFMQRWASNEMNTVIAIDPVRACISPLIQTHARTRARTIEPQMVCLGV